MLRVYTSSRGRSENRSLKIGEKCRPREKLAYLCTCVSTERTWNGWRRVKAASSSAPSSDTVTLGSFLPLVRPPSTLFLSLSLFLSSLLHTLLTFHLFGIVIVTYCRRRGRKRTFDITPPSRTVRANSSRSYRVYDPDNFAYGESNLSSRFPSLSLVISKVVPVFFFIDD